ncbi:MAG: hypothetical protein HUJ25_11020 [Crocinitomicaceae bacterium]|nr:hypothetical protein [Crocinitomicaceae bacterium]
MKRLIPILVVLVACSEAVDDKGQLTQEETDTTELTPVEPNTTDVKEVEVNTSLQNLLANPIDLVSFKKEWGPSNSGNASKPNGLYTPDTVGRVYRYSLFWKLRNVLPKKLSEGDLLNKFRITVFKYGHEIGNYYEQNEELLMVECATDNPELRKLNWYGKSRVEVMDQYGVPAVDTNNCLLFAHQNKVISAHFSEGQVDWFKYAQLSDNADISREVPEFLLNY